MTALSVSSGRIPKAGTALVPRISQNFSILIGNRKGGKCPIAPPPTPYSTVTDFAKFRG